MANKNYNIRAIGAALPGVMVALLMNAPSVDAQASGQNVDSSTQAADGGFKPTSYDDSEDPDELATDVSQLFDDRGVLTPRHALVLEPSLDLSYSSANRVAIEGFTIVPAVAVGLVDVREVRRSAVTAAATFRYGITNRLEIETRIPYVYRKDEVRSRQLLEPSSDDVIIDSDGNGLGDIEAALHYQFNMPRNGGAYYIGNLRAKSRTGTDVFEVDRDLVRQDDLVVGERLTEQPTGSGFWSVEPSLTIVYPSDPAVFFGNVSYTWNMERDINDRIGKVDPGDFVGFNFGMGFGVNNNTSFSLGYDHTVVFETKQEGVDNASEFDEIHVGRFMIGFNQRVAHNSNINFALAIGVTEDAPDIQLTFRSPIRLF
ncbi:hypothetical protein [Salinisphaera aquimarina]|uniref:MetA-pathway of phenol degradation n=1 Tax=Salinisphaera aquimarina TaxID=2094031 RepID=A0ABV7ES19_9GAMM